jgi:hypothetical protein
MVKRKSKISSGGRLLAVGNTRAFGLYHRLQRGDWGEATNGRDIPKGKINMK